MKVCHKHLSPAMLVQHQNDNVCSTELTVLHINIGSTELHSICDPDKLLGGRARGVLWPQPSGGIWHLEGNLSYKFQKTCKLVTKLIPRLKARRECTQVQPATRKASPAQIWCSGASSDLQPWARSPSNNLQAAENWVVPRPLHLFRLPHTAFVHTNPSNKSPAGPQWCPVPRPTAWISPAPSPTL